jgi:hypothetical protein
MIYFIAQERDKVIFEFCFFITHSKDGFSKQFYLNKVLISFYQTLRFECQTKVI